MSEKTSQRLRLSLRQLEVFAAIAREGSSRAAAARVSRSQSAASAALAELEAVLGVQLFDRLARRLVLN
ncbi:MAG: LysR family transcriptional regulator, partial [Burkholderiaceae bacterium]